jgi:hypothetical protein
MAGTVKDGGYEVPNIKDIARACHLEYHCIDDVLNQSLPDTNNGKIVEIKINKLTSVVPKLEFDKPLYNMIPYLTREEIKHVIYHPLPTDRFTRI